MPPSTLIAGLGNPGPKYERTRHNFGFMAVDALLDAGASRPLSMGKSGELHVLSLPGVGNDIFVLKPMTFMNDSGLAVAHVLNYYKLSVDNVMVVHDELDLPLGRMRMKKGGGLAGHNGLKSIAAHLSSQEFCRLRLGISRPAGQMDMAAYVLQEFGGPERDIVAKVILAAVAALRLFLLRGLDEAAREAGQFTALVSPGE
jgi:PTH1 family peptidyl-tRNA hydrolase